MKNIAILLAVATLLAGCADPERMFQSAEDSRSVDLYRQLISEFPDSHFAATAMERIADIESWQESEGQKNKEPYELYIEQYPDGLFAEDAAMQLKAIDAFAAVQEQDVIATYTQFENDYPNNAFSDDISRRSQELAQAETEYEALSSETNVMRFRAFIEEYSNTGYRQLAEQRMLELLPEPQIEFVLDQSVTGNWPDELLARFRETVSRAVRLASIETPVESNQVYVHYGNGFGIGFDGNGRAYNWFSHELRIEVRDEGDELTYEKTYESSVPGAHRGRTFSTGNTAGIARGPVDYELVLGDVEKLLMDDPL